MTFSERQGLVDQKAIQIESMDDDLRIGLWNGLTKYFWSYGTGHTLYDGDYTDVALREVVSSLWTNHLKLASDEIRYDWGILHNRIREYFMTCKWSEVYDFIEYTAPLANRLKRGSTLDFIEYCNSKLEIERSGYRFVGGLIVPISNDVELRSIEEALAGPYDSVAAQIRSALKKFSEKPKPDVRNCIKESICAVETAARLAVSSDRATLGDILPLLKEKIGLHPAQIKGWSAIYGWTSDEKAGIRHSMMDKDDLTSDDARYMLVTCSAFANYLLRLAERAGVLSPPKR